jgi:Helitron helicase-like domain at N-terminus
MHFPIRLSAQRQTVSLCRTGKNHHRTTYAMKFSLSAVLDVNGSTVSTDEIADYLLRKITGGRTNAQAANDSVYLIPHSSKPVNEYFNPTLLSSLYPTLFCYGRGAPEDQSRPVEIRLREHVRYLLSYSDRRFEKHPSFMFVVFNLLQRRDACFHAQLIATRPYFRASADDIQSLSTKDIETALDNIAKNSYSSKSNSKLNKLMHHLKTIGGRVMGSAYSRTALRTQIHALIFNQGLPSIFLTINPADIHSPVALYFAGIKLDLDNIQTEQLMTTYKRAETIASHPVATAKFFHLLITNILKTMIVGGVLGPIKAYFGTVESQGRGSLHLHMLIWLDHEMKPSDMKDKVHNADFREKLKAYLEDIIKEDLDQFKDGVVLENSDGKENIFHSNIIFGGSFE